MTTAVYYRVSTDKQLIDLQRDAVAHWVKTTKHADPVKEYCDLAMSGKTGKRPAFRKLMRDVKAGRVRTLVVYKLDRLTRDTRTAIKTILWLDELGVKFVAVTQPMFSHGTPFRHAMIAIFAELAQMERETISERVKAGMEAARVRGAKFGRPIKATEVLRGRAIELRGLGLTIKAIAKQLELSPALVHRITTPLVNDEQL